MTAQNVVARDIFVPDRMRRRPIDHRGFPVPWFVSLKTADGRWDFVHLDPARLDHAYRAGLCTLSGEPLGKFVAFVVGPMGIINRVAAQPPCIPDLGEWAAQVCPFLSRPLAKRPHVDAQETALPPGLMVPDNPGGCVVWVVRRQDYVRGRDGLYRFGAPHRVSWWTKGRQATPQEVRAIYEARADKLRAMAEAEGPDSLHRFELRKHRADTYLPQELNVAHNEEMKHA
jgi:hypothetical protein